MYNQIIDSLLKNIEIIEPMLNNASQLVKQNEKYIPYINYSFLDYINEIIEYNFMEDPSLEKDWETIELLHNAGFWYIPSLPHPVFKKLSQLDDKSKENISSLILELMNMNDYYQLTNIVNKWNLDVFKEKNIIFQEALQAHKEGKYVLSIPALALQVEPLIKNYLSLDHSTKIRKIKKTLKELMETCKDEKKKEIWIDENKSRPMYVYLISLKFISENVFEFYKGGQDFNNVKNTFNRHVIGHGALKTKDFNQELSTKLFLFLDTLHFVLSYFKEELLDINGNQIE